MATRTITVDQLAGGNFVGGGDDTLFLSGDWRQIFDLTKANFSGFTKIVTDASFTIKMTNAQFSSISIFQGTTNNSIQVDGPVIDLRGKQFTDIWGIRSQDNATFYADNVNAIYRVNAYQNIGDTFKYFGSLSEDQRNEVHDQGFDVVVDQTMKETRNFAPVLQGLNGDQQFVGPGKAGLIDAGSDAIITDDRGPIAGIWVSLASPNPMDGGMNDYVRIVPDDKFYFAKSTFYGFDIIYNDVNIGSYSKDSYFNGGISFSFNKRATSEMVHHILHRVEYVRGDASRADKLVKIDVIDRGGLRTSASVMMKGVEEPKESPNRIDGGKGKDVLAGTAGKDHIYGGYGNDKLTGGAGADVFVFNSKLGTSKTDRKVNFDTITDFSAKDDAIWLDNRYFTKLGKGTESAPGSLNKKFFYMGSEAKAKSHYLLYNKKTGILSYDQDGSGAKAAIEIAKMGKNLKLSTGDFFVI